MSDPSWEPEYAPTRGGASVRTRHTAKWVARRYPSTDGFLRGSSQIRVALRCFVSQMGDEKPHRNAKYAYLYATRVHAVGDALTVGNSCDDATCTGSVGQSA